MVGQRNRAREEEKKERKRDRGRRMKMKEKKIEREREGVEKRVLYFVRERGSGNKSVIFCQTLT